MSKVVRYDADGREIIEIPEGYGESLISETADMNDVVEVTVSRVAYDGTERGAITQYMSVEDLRDAYVALAEQVGKTWHHYGACDSDDESDVLSSGMEVLSSHVHAKGFWAGDDDELPESE